MQNYGKFNKEIKIGSEPNSLSTINCAIPIIS